MQQDHVADALRRGATAEGYAMMGGGALAQSLEEEDLLQFNCGGKASTPPSGVNLEMEAAAAAVM